MITLTFPDCTQRQVASSMTAAQLAASISVSLGKRAVAVLIDGVLHDLSTPLVADGKVKILTRDDAEALELIRHDCAHVLAQAVQELFPGTQATIGPVIDNGFYYDFYRDQPFTLDDFAAIEREMRAIIARDNPFTKRIVSRQEAIAFFKEKGETFKVELIAAIPPDQEIKLYDQGGWVDLCRGPHMNTTGKIGQSFKLLKVAGAYWRGDAKNPMLTRIYGTAFAHEKELKAYLAALEEAEKRDHRRLGKEMDLFHFQEEAPGSVFWHPKGWTLFQGLISYMRRCQLANGYCEVNSPDMMDRTLWEVSGHWQNYHSHMFTSQTEDKRVFAFKPMNCPGHVQIFKSGLKSYRDLPLKISEFGKVHRYEPSGSLHGLMRVRSFTQDDAHIFCTEEQIEQQCLEINDFVLSIYRDFGFDEVHVRLSTRPEKRVGDDHLWDHAEEAMRRVLAKFPQVPGTKIKTSINHGDGAFYGPKFDYVLRDAIGREWQCGTIQLDFNLPGRFDASYIDHHSNRVVPVMIHRAMFGSLERFCGILIEHFSGAFPFWLAPVQIVVATIVSEADDYARTLIKQLHSHGLRVEADLRNEKINYKVREHSVAKVPVLLVVGKREMEEGTVNIRRFGSQEQKLLGFEEALMLLKQEACSPDLRKDQ